jgi:hypothetical protein
MNILKYFKRLLEVNNQDLTELIHNIHPQWKHLDKYIQHVVTSSEDYIVAIDIYGDIEWETSDDYDVKTTPIKDKLNEFKNCISSMECQPLDHHDQTIKLNFKRLLGEALVRVFELDYESAKSMIERQAIILQKEILSYLECGY